MDNRDRYRSMYTYDLLRVAREEGVTVEMGIVLAEKLAGSHHHQGVFQPRSTKA